MLRDGLTFARFVQAAWWFSMITVLTMFGTGWAENSRVGGTLAVVSFVAGSCFTMLIMFSMRCKSCGVSYYFKPSKGGWNLSGVDLTLPVKANCPKCGAAR